MKSCGTAGRATDDDIIWRMRVASWITKATDTHKQYVILPAFLPQEWSRERASVSRLHVRSLSCYLTIETLKPDKDNPVLLIRKITTAADLQNAEANCRALGVFVWVTRDEKQKQLQFRVTRCNHRGM